MHKGEIVNGRLSVDTLQLIINSVKKIQDTKVKVQQIEVAGHIVTLDRTDDQRDGLTYYITAIRPVSRPSTGPTYRRTPQAQDE